MTAGRDSDGAGRTKTGRNGTALLRALAQESRLRAFAAVVLGAASTAEVLAATGLAEREAIEALARLEAADLIARSGPGWTARVDVLRRAAAAARATAPLDHGASDPEVAAVLRAFLPEGRIVVMPAQDGKRRIVLDHVSRVFEPGRRYPEPDVDGLLRAFADDYVMLRRYLVDYGLLAREAGEYWRIGGPVDV